MKLHRILATVVVALITSAQAIKPASAQVQAQYSLAQDRLFLETAQGVFTSFGEDNYYRGNRTIANAHMVMGRSYCTLLNLRGRSMEDYKQRVVDLTAQGEEEQALITWAVLEGAVKAYCPQQYQQYRETFSQP